MKLTTKNSILALAAVGAIALPVGAAAKPGNGQGHGQGNGGGHGQAGEDHGNGHGNGHGPKGVGYVFKGTYAGEETVSVTKGNKHVRNAGLIGTDVVFDLSGAKIVVADTNGDGEKTLDDVATGDKVLVKARLPKADPGEQPYAARKLIDQTGDDDDPYSEED